METLFKVKISRYKVNTRFFTSYLGYELTCSHLYKTLTKMKEMCVGMLVDMEPELFPGGIFIKFLNKCQDKVVTILVTRWVVKKKVMFSAMKSSLRNAHMSINQLVCQLHLFSCLIY